MLGVAIASPVTSPYTFVERRQGTSCGGTDANGQIFVADVGFYSEMNCNDETGGVCIYTGQETIDAGAGNYGCNPGLLPEDAPFFLKVVDSPFSALQLLFTRDQSCPPSGPGAVYATLVDNASCVQSNLGGDAPGISVFPNGGSGLTRLSTPAREFPMTGVTRNTAANVERQALAAMKRQSNTECDGFVTDSQQPSQSRTVQVSNIIDCTNGGEQGCIISVEEQESKSISTSYSLTAGGGIEGIFSVEATFGMEFTQEVSTSVQNGFNVDAGQRGYIGAYNGATLFTGRYTGCNSGDAEQPGSVLALKDNQIFYSIILTGASKN